MMRALTFLMPQTNDVFVDIASSSPKQTNATSVRHRHSPKVQAYPVQMYQKGKPNFIKKKAKSLKRSRQLMSMAKVA
jgi:hypothetical protein